MRLSVKISNIKNAIDTLKQLKLESTTLDTEYIDKTIEDLQDELDFLEELNREESI